MKFSNILGSNKAAIGFALISTAIVVGASFGSSDRKQTFQIQYPDLSMVKPCAAEDPDPCAAESAALAAAIANLEAARATAEAAYAAWEACEEAHNPNPNPDPDPPQTVELTSVLESSK